MASQRSRVAVYDVATYQNGRAFKPAETRAESGLPIVKIAELNRGITPTTGRFDGEVDAKYLITKGDVIFAWSGTIVVKRWDGPDAVLNQHLFKVEAKDGYDQDFVYYLLRSLVPTFQQLVEDQRTTMGHVKVADLKVLQVLVPGRDEQRAVGQALRTLDDRVDANTATSALIEELITALYLEAQAGTTRETTVGQIASVTKGVSYRTVDLQASSTALVSLKVFGRGGGFQSDGLKPYVGSAKPAQRVASGDIVVAQTDITQAAEVMGRAVRIPDHLPFEDLVASMDCCVVRPSDDVVPSEFLCAALSTTAFRAHCRAWSNGTTVLHLANGAIEAYPLKLPPPYVMESFAQRARALWAYRDSLANETQHLRSLVDEMTPLMVDGAIPVPDLSEAA